MKRNPADQKKDDQERQRNLRELEEIEKKLKSWSFDTNDRGISISEAYQIESNICRLSEEDQSSIVLMEVDKLFSVIKQRHSSMAIKVALLENEVQLLNNEIRNKIIHRMDTEDIKYSIYKQVLTKAKVDIFSDAADTYKSLAGSLEGIRKLRRPEDSTQEYIQVRSLLQSEFYNCKVKAQLCYEDCYKRLVMVTRQTSSDAEEIKACYLRHKMALSTSL
jgi:hypothetical protein